MLAIISGVDQGDDSFYEVLRNTTERDVWQHISELHNYNVQEIEEEEEEDIPTEELRKRIFMYNGDGCDYVTQVTLIDKRTITLYDADGNVQTFNPEDL